jgi:hypothetical protein
MAQRNKSDGFKPLSSGDRRFLMVSIEEEDREFARLPYALKILCENVARHHPEECDAFRFWLDGGDAPTRRYSFIRPAY